MLFNSFEFLLFAAVVYPVYFRLRARAPRTLRPLLASWAPTPS